MFIRGALTTEDVNYIKDDFDDFLIYFTSVERGDHADGVLYENGESHLHDAIELLSLLDPNKAAMLKKIWQQEITSDENYRGDETSEYSYLMSREQLNAVIELLEGIDENLLTIADQQGYLKPFAVNSVQRQNPLLLERETLSGHPVYTLGKPLFHAKTVLRFFKLAQKLKRQIEVS